MADTVGDELELATQGKAQFFGISLKDRAAVLPGGFAADAAYWIDPKSGAFVTSTYTVPTFQSGPRISTEPSQKYWDREWKTRRELSCARLRIAKVRRFDAGFYEVIRLHPFANEYEFAFAKELMVYENVGRGPATDLLSISLSATIFSATRSA